MYRALVFSIALALSVPISSVQAAQAGAGSISGAARDASGHVTSRTTVQLRDVTTGQLAGTTTSDATGQFTFVGLQPGTYAVEVVNAAGEIVGTSATISVAAGAAVTGVSVAAAATTAAGGAFLASTAGLITLAASGAAVAGVTVAAGRTTASASR